MYGKHLFVILGEAAGLVSTIQVVNYLALWAGCGPGKILHVAGTGFENKTSAGLWHTPTASS